MDEISMVTALRPEPAGNAQEIRRRARARLEEALHRTPAGSAGIARTFRRRPAVLATVAAAAATAAAIAVPAALPGGSTPAWAVQKKPDGTVSITIRELRDLGGLQRALRADGVPAYIRPGPIVRAVTEPNGTKAIRIDIQCDWQQRGRPHVPRRIQDAVIQYTGGTENAIVIHPSAMPKGTTVLIEANYNKATGIGFAFRLLGNDRPPRCVSVRPAR